MHLSFRHKVETRFTEQRLAELCRQGDNEARRELYERYAGKMLAVGMRYMNNRQVAEDLLHDAFIKLFASFDKFEWRGDGTLPAWLNRVMTNEVLMYLRKADVLNKAADLDEISEVNNTADTPDADRVDDIPQEVLMQFVEELPVGYRTVFNLYVFEGKSHREIGEMLGIQERSSASQLARAKAALANRINEWLKDNG